MWKVQRIATSPRAVLGLDEGASLDEVRHAFRVQAKKTHPDHGGDRAAFEALRAAFEDARPLAARRTKPAAWPRPRNPYAWCDQPVPPAPLPRFQPPPRPQPRPGPRRGGEAFANVLESVLAAA
jgi:hypothetical protein